MEEVVQRFIAERRSATIFKEVLLAAAEIIGAGIVHFGKEKPLVRGPPTDYTTALVRMQETASSEPASHLLGPDQRKHAWSDVRKFLNQQEINPVRAVALATNDPIQRTLFMGIAELSNVFHMQTAVIAEQLSRDISERGVKRVGQLPEEQFNNLMATADRLISMIKATERCSQPRTTIIESRILDSPTIPRLSHSG